MKLTQKRDWTCTLVGAGSQSLVVQQSHLWCRKPKFAIVHQTISTISQLPLLRLVCSETLHIFKLILSALPKMDTFTPASRRSTRILVTLQVSYENLNAGRNEKPIYLGTVGLWLNSTKSDISCWTPKTKKLTKLKLPKVLPWWMLIREHAS